MKIVGLLVACFITSAVNAAFVSRDYSQIGDGLIMFDDATKLEWLSLYETRFLSYSSVMNGSGVGDSGSTGWIKAGFRYATQNEISELFVNLGADNFLGMRTVNNYNALSRYSNFVQPYAYTAGAGYEDKEWWGIYPVLMGDSMEIHFSHMTWSERQVTGHPELGTTIYGEIILDSMESSFGARGSFLVRDVSAIPIPSTMLLFLSGLVFLLARAGQLWYSPDTSAPVGLSV